jgi:hypothetical protein
MTYKFNLEVAENEIVLTPEKHEFTLIWIHGLSESPQTHLRYILTRPLLDVLLSLYLGAVEY